MRTPSASIACREDRITIVVPASTASVRLAAAAAKGVAETVLPPDEAEHIEVVVAEVGNNIVAHGFGARDGHAPGRSFTLSLLTDQHALTLEFDDDAPPFDPVSVPPGTPEQSIAKGGGGLGLFIIRRIMDELRYERRGAHNIFRLRKHCQCALGPS